VSFALWWALVSLPGGIWPSFGTSGVYGATQWWVQTPNLPAGRPQISVQHGHWSLRYGTQAQGWGWQLQSRYMGIWWSPDKALGLSGQYRGTYRGSQWDLGAAWSPQGWTARGHWKGLSAVRTYQKQFGLGYQLESTKVDVQWGPALRSFGIRHGDLEWRRSTSAVGITDLVRLRRGHSTAEWRSTTLEHHSQQQIGFRTCWGPNRLGIQMVANKDLTQTLARISYSQTKWGTATLGYSGRQAMIRYHLPDRGSFRGSFVEWGPVAQIHAVHRGRGLAAVWNPKSKQLSLQIFARHQFAPKHKSEPVPQREEITPCWLDVTYTFAGQPPNVELQLHGTSTYRVVLIPQNRQWKDHVPPGRYAVTGSAPKGWKLELPADSITLAPGTTSPVWIGLKPHVTQIRWVSDPSESSE
jgi:hypothetical protein